MQGGLIRRTAKRLERVFLMPFQVLHRKIRKILNPDSFASQVVQDVRKGIGKKGKQKERTLKDYFSFGRYYVLKKVAYLALLLLLALPILYMKLLHPLVVSRFFPQIEPARLLPREASPSQNSPPSPPIFH